MSVPDTQFKIDDLAFAKACLDWTYANFIPFEGRERDWLQENVDTRIEEVEANPTHNLFILFEKEPLPLEFSVEVGAYINTIRSSLDILATVLNQRHGVTREKDVFFPIVECEASFKSGKGFKGHEFVNGLPPVERAKIEDLRPYNGGDPLLWALHSRP